MNKKIIILLLVISTFTFLFPKFQARAESPALSKDVLIELTNKERILNGKIPLKESSVLNKVAMLKAKDEANKGYFAHTSIEGKSSWYWFALVGYKFTTIGENLAVLFNDEKSVVQAWMNSPSHKANILRSKFTQIGMAVVSGLYKGQKTSYVVEVFGNPKNIK